MVKVICNNCGTGEVKNQYPQSMWCDDCAAALRLLYAQMDNGTVIDFKEENRLNALRNYRETWHE